MPSILVIEHEGRYIERIQDALSSEGWKARFVAGRPEALRAAASEQPDLVLINADLPGAAEMLRTFSTHQGGPGAVALIPEHHAPVEPAELGADEVMAKPFTDQQLRLVVRRGLRRPHGDAGPAPAAAPPSGEEGPKLTSEDIFGDLLQEVDSAPAEEGATPAAQPPAGQPTAAKSQAGAEASGPETSSPETSSPKPSPPPPAAKPAAKSRRADSRLASDDPEIAKRLEMTLSGVLEESPASGGRGKARRGGRSGDGAKKPPAAEAAPKERRKGKRRRGSDDVDELLNLTLSSLEEPKKRRTKKRRKRSDEVDLSEIAALAGGRRKPSSRRPKPEPEPEAEMPASSLEPPPFPGAADLEIPEELDLDAVERERITPEAEAPETGAEAAAADLDLPDLEAPDLEPQGLEAQDLATPQDSGRRDFDDETFDEVFDASWGEAVPSDDSSYEVKPPDDFEPRGLGGTAGASASEGGQNDGERFGHYRLLDRIAVGGMAEVWKARMSGVEGFQKTVAIKKILPQMTDNKDFVSMFIDEAKLAAQLNHPNITHIYDLGKIERDYYIAMEYVEGRNLRDVLNQARRKGKPLPVGLALVIAARLASGLDYAHRKRDFDDRELELVHRDVSPQNVLLSYEGDIKLCDFGIVKAVTKATHTQMGALKGKLQYMSPEQAWGRTVDSRSDIFSLGVLLFEMLTGERLFAGDNEISVLESVRECQVRSPEELNPGLPGGVEEIALRALAKEPDDRYDNAGEMQGELEAVLYRLKPTPTQADLGTWLRELDEAEDLSEEARQRFTWSTGDVAAVAGGDGGDGGGVAGPTDVRPEADGVASPFGVDPGDVGATQPVRVADLGRAASAAGPDAGTDDGTTADSGIDSGTDGSTSSDGGTGTDSFTDTGSFSDIGSFSGTDRATDTDSGTVTESGTDTESGTGAALAAAAGPGGELTGTGTATGTGVGLPPADGEADGWADDSGTGDAAEATFGEGTATAMAPPEGKTVTPEEGGRRGLWILAAAILLLLIIGAVWFFGFPTGDPAPTTEPAAAATEPAEVEAADGEAADGQAGAAVAGEDGAASATDGNEAGEGEAGEGESGEALDLEAMLDEQMAAKEAEIESAVREDREPELERLRAELRRLRQREAQALADAAAAEAGAEESGETGDGAAEAEDGSGAGDAGDG